METTFDDWTLAMLGPHRSEQLSGIYDLCVSVLGENAEMVFSRHITRTGIDGNQEIIDSFYADMVEVLTVCLNQYGIIARDSILNPNHIPVLGGILETLLQIENYELPHEIITLYEGAGDNVSFLTQMVIRLTETDQDDIAELLHTVPDSLVKRIIEITNDRIMLSDVDTVVTQKGNAPVIAKLLNMTEMEHPVIDYYRNGNPMGYNMSQYLSVFSNQIYEVQNRREAATLWLLLWAYAGNPYEQITARITAYLESVYTDTQISTAVYREIRVLLQELAQ